MKKLILPMAMLCMTNALFAQFVEVSYEADYSAQTYYQLEDDATTTVYNIEWDIAFSTIGFADAAIFLNEATGASGTPLELYTAPTNEFSDDVNPEELENPLYNDELSWDYGAFNSTRLEDNPFDLGWGEYNPTDHTINATKVYVIKLRDESYKKLQIVSLVSTTYTFKYADLDGSNEVTQTINKADFPDADFAYFSFDTEQTISSVPDEWDLVFTRYITPLDDGEGNLLDYLVTGTLSGVGVEVAQADAIDPENVSFDQYADSLKSTLDIIGYDWKAFDLTTFQWSLPTDRAYFVKTAAGDLWKIVFIDFEGSGTGNAVFQKTALGTVSNVDRPSAFQDFNVFPNPVVNEATVTYTVKTAGRVNISIGDVFGRKLWSASQTVAAGFNATTLPALDLPTGTYILTLEANGDVVSQRIIKQ